MPQSQSSTAIILRTRAYGDIDVIATFLTRDYGKLTGIAKGAKHSRRRFVNCLDPFCRVRVFFRQKPTSTLAFLERCELLHSGFGMAATTRFAYGSYILELVDLLTHEADPIANVYDLFEMALTLIENGPATSALLRCFELHLLGALGYAPPLQYCHRCAQAFASEGVAFYDALQAQVLCGRCGSPGPHLVRFDSATLHTMARLQETPLEESRAMPIQGDTARQAATFTGHLLSTHLPRPLRSLELIVSLTR